MKQQQQKKNMVEGGFVKADKTEYTECFKITLQTPYIMRLALSAGIGGLLFGYDTGVISGALLYIKDDFEEVKKKTWMQETIVAMAIAGAIFGAGIGGWLNDKVGRRWSILIADILFFFGSIVMAIAPTPLIIILGRVVVGLGVGMASVTAPLYISETSPNRIRGALVSTNGLLITGGQFLSYLINLGFTKVNGTWRWMLGVAAVPAIVQFILMLSLPESPRYLYRKNNTREAEAILARIYPADEVEEEIRLLKQSVENELAIQGEIAEESILTKIKEAWSNKIVRRGLYAGITVQVAQQFAGINTVMYYSPMIIQFAGFASKQTALALSLISSGLNALGTIVSMVFVDRYGRRRLMIISMFGIIACLTILAAVFQQSAATAPKLSIVESTHFGVNNTCPSYLSAPNAGSWTCMSCLAAESPCAFCSTKDSQYKPGACIIETNENRAACGGESRTYFTEGCPSQIGFLAVVIMGAYIVSYAPGMGTVPWIVNSEIYPLRFRGVGGGIAAVSNWTASLIVSETFLTITKHLGSSGAFLLFAAFSLVSLLAIYFLVPETKGMPIEEVEKMLERGFKPSLCGGGRGDNPNEKRLYVK